jgi:hypothetical protein
MELVYHRITAATTPPTPFFHPRVTGISIFERSFGHNLPIDKDTMDSFRG